MILLTSINDKLQVVTSAIGQVDVHASYADASGSPIAVALGRANARISTAATTDVVAAPDSGTSRNIKNIKIANTHATVSNTVSILHTDGSTAVEIEKATLAPGERMGYEEGVGIRVFDINGAEKTAVPALGQVVVARLGADQSNSTVTPTEVTGLTVPCGAGTWMFQYFLILQSANTATGHRLSVNHTGTVTSFDANMRWGGGTLNSADVPNQAFTTAGGEITSAFTARAKSTAGWGTTTGVDTLNADVLYVVEGIAVVTVGGNLALWHGSEVAAASTIKAGSSLQLVKTG